MDDLILTTTPNVEGKRITGYLGIVTGEAIKYLYDSITDLLHDRSEACERELIKARNIALQEVADAARKLGANAVVGIDLDYAVLSRGLILIVSASGTAVRVE